LIDFQVSIGVLLYRPIICRSFYRFRDV